jgi:hypothetical protein
MLIPGLHPLSRNEPCELCRSSEVRELSHIIPKFVFRHARVRAQNQYLRSNTAPNRRIQDGFKEYLLCAQCEQLFSNWERGFSEIFKDHYQNPSQNIVYTESDALCALSILWRALAHARLHPEIEHPEFGTDYSRTDPAYCAWREVLLGRTKNPGKYRIMWVFLDYVQKGHSLGRNVNRYLFHGSDTDVYASSSESFAYAHIPGIIIIGALEGIARREFRDFDVSFSGGRYFADENKKAPAFLFEIIKEKNRETLEAGKKVSPEQMKKIGQDALKSPRFC